jgi:succinate dehydrogenase/fumarate reductase flavoprotein subunit
MTAALVAAHEGLRVMLCEKAAVLGGTTAWSGGEIWIPGSRHAREAGIAETVAEAERYWDAEVGSSEGRDLRSTYLATGPEAIDYLERHTEVRFRAVNPHPDYHQDLPGASAGGRPLATLPFDGRSLGDDLALLRPPRPEFTVFGGMMVSRDDIAALLKPFASLRAFSHAATVLARHARDRLFHGRGTRLVMGNALVARMLASLRKHRVEIATSSPLASLVREDGRVTGAVVALDGTPTRIGARRGVVLATGGFAADPKLRARYMPATPADDALASEGDVGDGLTAAIAVGATVDTAMRTPAYWMPASAVPRADGTRAAFPHIRDRAKPGLIAVDARGERFTNESGSYHDFALAQFAGVERGVPLPGWLVCDRRFVREQGLGVIKPIPQRLAPFVRSGYLVEGRTLEELARRIGADAARLAASVKQNNDAAARGVDAAFGKGSSIYHRHYGDASHGPNPCLGVIEPRAVLRGGRAPVPIGTTVGIRIDTNANALDADGAPIPGLYACGNDMASITRGAYPGPGSTIGPAIVFGYRAAKHLAA